MQIGKVRMLRVVLFVSGMIAAGIGGAILSMPVAFYATYGIEIGSDASLLNEIRAPGGALLASGVLIMLGAFVASLTLTSAVVSALLYVSYGMARILSMAIDGMPDGGLVQAAILEMAIGLVCVCALVRYRKA